MKSTVPESQTFIFNIGKNVLNECPIPMYLIMIIEIIANNIMYQAQCWFPYRDYWTLSANNPKYTYIIIIPKVLMRKHSVPALPH